MSKSLTITSLINSIIKYNDLETGEELFGRRVYRNVEDLHLNLMSYMSESGQKGFLIPIIKKTRIGGISFTFNVSDIDKMDIFVDIMRNNHKCDNIHKITLKENGTIIIK